MNITTVVAYINIIRAIHHAPPVIPTAKLNWAAGNWSEHMAKTNKFDHSPYPYGENIAYIPINQNYTAGAIAAVNMFYAEKSAWLASNKTPNSAGHFTQLVWKSTRYIGIGIASNKKNMYISFEFDPAGNVWGQYVANVG